MRLSFKILAWSWVVLFIVMVILVFNAYSKLKPENLVSLLEEQVRRNYPGAELEIENVKYTPSVDLKFSLNNIVLKRKDKIISRLGEIELKVPWWLLIFNRGNAQVNLNDLEIFIDNELVEPNKVVAAKDSNSSIKLTLPENISTAQFTLRAKNISFKDSDSDRNIVKISKLLVREFQFGKNSAFELKLPVAMNHKGVNYLSELWLFGDITPEDTEWNLNYRGEFRTKDAGDKLQFEDVVIDGKTKFKPHKVDLQTTLVLLVDKEQIGIGELIANKGDVNIELEFQKLPVSYLHLFENEIRNPYLNKLEGNAKGEVKYYKKYKEGMSRFDGHLIFSGSFPLAAKEKMDGQWRLAFDNSRWESSFISPKGEISFFRRSVIDYESGKIVQYEEELGFTNLDASAALKNVVPLDVLLNAPANEYFTTKISCKSCLWGDVEMNGKFNLGVAFNKKFYLADIEINQSKKLAINFEQVEQKKKLDLTAANFPWNENIILLAPYFEASFVNLDGKFNGRWSTEWLEGEWLVKIKADQIRSMKGILPDLVRDFSKEFGLDTGLVNEVALNASSQKGTLKIDSLILGDTDPAKITALYDSKQMSKSHMTLSYPKNPKWKSVRKVIAQPFWKKE